MTTVEVRRGLPGPKCKRFLRELEGREEDALNTSAPSPSPLSLPPFVPSFPCLLPETLQGKGACTLAQGLQARSSAARLPEGRVSGLVKLVRLCYQSSRCGCVYFNRKPMIQGLVRDSPSPATLLSGLSSSLDASHPRTACFQMHRPRGAQSARSRVHRGSGVTPKVSGS